MCPLVKFNSSDTAHVAIMAVILAVAEATVFRTVHPLLPPIFIAPFVMCFVLGASQAFCRKQWAIGLVAFVLTVLASGTIMPGQFMIPVYGVLFSVRSENWWESRIAGSAATVLHFLYGVFLAPLIFSVAPAKAIVTSAKAYNSNMAWLLAAIAIAFGVCGMLAADAGRRTGMRIGLSMRDPHVDN